ncbi:hypothetical protein NL676_017211 [Syzygium grande]|nr:hypothetical protein NL676_017211 [Syzygium grande]
MVGRCLKLLIKVRVAEFQQQQGIEVEMVMRVVTNDLTTVDPTYDDANTKWMTTMTMMQTVHHVPMDDDAEYPVDPTDDEANYPANYSVYGDG